MQINLNVMNPDTVMKWIAVCPDLHITRSIKLNVHVSKILTGQTHEYKCL